MRGTFFATPGEVYIPHGPMEASQAVALWIRFEPVFAPVAELATRCRRHGPDLVESLIIDLGSRGKLSIESLDAAVASRAANRRKR